MIMRVNRNINKYNNYNNNLAIGYSNNNKKKIKK